MSGSHFLAPALVTHGYDVKLMPPENARPFVRSNKNDDVEVEAIAEAVQRPAMRFVSIKKEPELNHLAPYRVRDR